MYPKLFSFAILLLLATYTHAQRPVHRETQSLKKLVSEILPDSIQLAQSLVARGITLQKDLAGNVVSENASLPIPSSGKGRLTRYGMYEILAEETRIWRWDPPQNLQQLSNQSAQVWMENTPFWIRFVQDSDNPAEDAIIWKEDVLQLPIRLAHAAGLYSPGDSLQRIQQWFDLLDTLDANPFFHHQLASFEFNRLPASHPLMPELLVRINRILQQLPDSSHISGTRRPQASAYFSLEDLTKTYQQPSAADGATDLRESEQRLKSNAPPSSFGTEAVIAGLTDFVIERAKEEFSITFLEGFQNNLDSSNTKFGIQELAILFPQTTAFFTGKNTLTDYKNFLPSAKAFFVRDLQNMGLQMHRLLEKEPYAQLRNAGDIYHIALFYDMASMAFQGFAPDTLLDNLTTRLDQRQQQLFLQVNRNLALSTSNQPVLDSLQHLVFLVDTSLTALELAIKGKTRAIEFLVLPKLIGAAQNDPVLSSSIHSYWDEIAAPNERLFNWLLFEKANQLSNIPSLLHGQRYYDAMLEAPRLEDYPEFFGTAPDSSIQLIASGIDLAKKFVRPNGGKQPFPEFLVDYYRQLSGIEQRLQDMLDVIQAKRDTNKLKQNTEVLKKERDSLVALLNREFTFWESKPGYILDDAKALQFIQGGLANLSLDVDQKKPDSWHYALQQKEKQLNEAKQWARERILHLEDSMKLQSPGFQSIHDTYIMALQERTAQVNPAEEENVQQVILSTDSLRDLLYRLDAQYAAVPAKSYRQAALLGDIAQMSSSLLSCLRDSVNGSLQYIQPDAFWEIMRDEQQRDFFLGIVQQRLQAVIPRSPLSSKNVATATMRLADLAYKSYALRDSLRTAPREKLQFTDYLPFVRMGVDMLTTFIQNPLVEKGRPMDELQTFASVNHYILSLFEDVQNRRYGNAVEQVANLFELIVDSDPTAKTRWAKVRSPLVRYAGFMANVAAARTAEDMKGALLAAALPPGSSRIKRESSFNIGLNTYLGLAVGREQLETTVEGVKRDAYSLGLSLPVGISTSWGVSKTKKASMSVLLSVLDLGTMASFRLGDPRADLLPEVRWENFIAPGGYLLYNAPKSPFSFGAGAQYGPRTRSITSANGVETSTPAWRYGFFLGIDVPVFSFATHASKWQKKGS